jgi:hypothetical protein
LLASAFEDEVPPTTAQPIAASTAAITAESESEAKSESDEAPVAEEAFHPSVIAASTTPAKGQITIAIRRELVEKNHEALAVLKRRIEAVVKGFDFVESIVKVEAA